MTDQERNTAPDPDRCHELIETLASAWTASRESVKVTATVEQVFAPVVFAHVAHTVRLAATVSERHRTGHGLVMMPLVRQVIECSIRAVWLEQYRGNVRALVRDGLRNART